MHVLPIGSITLNDYNVSLPSAKQYATGIFDFKTCSNTKLHDVFNAVVMKEIYCILSLCSTIPHTLIIVTADNAQTHSALCAQVVE